LWVAALASALESFQVVLVVLTSSAVLPAQAILPLPPILQLAPTASPFPTKQYQARAISISSLLMP
ncbi:MAG: hypothetical protein Q8J74_01125, partial [Candidatus Didemnitutus sp.]|nr:hypothetical protein [Candidatus Didemnitutus sp.]